MKTQDTQKYVGAVEAAVKILRRLAEIDQSDGVASIARDTGLNVSTTFNILKTLTKDKLVSFDGDTKTYSISMGILELATPVIARPPADLIRPTLTELVNKHTVPIALWTISGTNRLVLTDRVLPVGAVHVDIPSGVRLPVLAGAIGRCIAAERKYSKSEMKPEFDKIKWQDPPGFETYLSQVEEARKDGYALDMAQLFFGLNMVGATIVDRDGHPRLALSAISIANQISDDSFHDIGRDLRDAAKFIAKNIFGDGQANTVGNDGK